MSFSSPAPAASPAATWSSSWPASRGPRRLVPDPNRRADVARLATLASASISSTASSVRPPSASSGRTGIFHCAGAPHVAASWHDTTKPLAVNVLATHNLLDAVRACRPSRAVSSSPVRRTVYAPSADPIRRRRTAGAGEPVRAEQAGPGTARRCALDWRRRRGRS